MTFSELTRQTVTAGQVPGERPRASVIVRSAEGAPNKQLGIAVRAPVSVTDAQTQKLRSTRRAA